MMTGRYGRVAVLMGGRSAEREVSLMSGNAVLEALKRKGVDVHPFDTRDQDLHDLKVRQFDRAFIALHGRYGEDGTVQGMLELMGIPYTGSGVMASALAMDKYRTKLVWMAAGIPTPRFAMLSQSDDLAARTAHLGFPLIIKPSREGSTIGLTKVRSADELSAAYDKAALHDRQVLAEEFIAGPEVTASILDGHALPLIRIEAPAGNYDYHAKYFSDETRYLCPSGLPDAEESRLRELALRAFQVLGCEGWGRIDVMIDRNGAPFLLEANTVPGMTGHSLVPMAAKAAGIAFDDLVIRILEGAHVE